MAVRIRKKSQKNFDAAWQRQQLVRDMKRRMSHEEKRRKGERLLLHAIRMSTLIASPAPPAWIFGCNGVEQGDTGAGVLLSSDQARDLCACSVLTPWAWCWVQYVVVVGQTPRANPDEANACWWRAHSLSNLQDSALHRKLWLCALQYSGGGG
jgi:hypothetical protein